MSTVLVIVLYTYRASSRSMLRVSDDLLAQHSALAIEKTVNYLEPASVVSDLSRAIYRDGILDIGDSARFQQLAVAILKKYPQFVIFNYGNERGNIYGVERGEGGKRIVFQTTRPTPDEKIATYVKTFQDAQGKTIKVEREPTPYNPTVRPWYQGAVGAKGRYWTGAYVLITDRRQIAISVAYPVRNRQGALQGVVAGDLGIRELSTFLSRLKVGKSGFVLILDEANRVVAHPQFDKAFVKTGAKVRLKHVKELGHAWLDEALRRYTRTGTRRTVVEHDGTRHIVGLTPFPASFGKRWKILVSVPENDFIGELRDTNRLTLLLSLGVLLLSLLLISAIAKRISRPIVLLTEEANRIRELQLDGDDQIDSTISEIKQISRAVYRMKTGMRAFKKYVPATLVKQLVETGEEVRLGGRKRDLTIFFSDIQGFTTISESLDPEQLMTHLSEYLDELTRILMAHRGTVDKYIGDAIMAFWNAPLPTEDHAFAACAAAVKCQRALDELNGRWRRQGLPAMPTRIGLHTGETIVGNVGSSDRMNYTVLGDTANLASRLEGVNKVYSTRIIISEATHERVADRVLARALDLVIVKGRTQPTRIFELVDVEPSVLSAEQRADITRYDEAFAHHLDQQWDEAIALLEGLHERSPDDPVVARLLHRCRRFRDDPPTTEDWHCTKLDSK
ncbi:MAG: adenylate/guanylate cyclase domain-containing protein [bacterium]